MFTRKATFLAASFAAACLIGRAHATPTVDGTLDGEYGSPLAVQAAPTQFGDSNSGSVTSANGSEIDASYGEVSNGRLYLFFSGNLETNFNKLDIFLDSTTGGENQLQPTANDHGLNRMAAGGGGTTNPGLKFDAGFTADRWISVTAGNNPLQMFADYGDLDAGTQAFAGGNTSPDSATPPPPTLTGGDAGVPAIQLSVNESNTTGVTGSTAPNDAATVSKGVELSIALADIGNPTGPIGVTAFVNGVNHDFISNQFGSPLPAGQGNLGEPTNVDLSAIAGNQFFTVPVPEPTSLAMLGLLGLMAVRRRA